MKKRIITLTILIVITIIVSAQPPQAFKYQAIVRNSNGELISNQPVVLRISIRNNSVGGTIAYQESFYETTNQFGLVNLNIGTGTPSIGTFSGIDWSSDSKFMQVEYNDGTIYVQMGTSELFSVPYALYSDRSADGYWEPNGSGIYYNNGNVGIGTSNPVNPLVIKTTAAGDAFNILSNTSNYLFRLRHTSNNSGGLYLYDGSANNTVFLYGGGNSFINSGNLGIGTSSPQSLLHVNGTAIFGTTTKGIQLRNTGALVDIESLGTGLALNYQTGENTVMNVVSGMVGIGNSNPLYKLDVLFPAPYNSQDYITKFRNSSTSTVAAGIKIQLGPVNPGNTNQFIVFYNGYNNVIGGILGDGSGGIFWNSLSDARLKKNIVDFKGGLEMVSHMRVRQYEMISAPGIEQVGFLAQELQEVYPRAVSGTPDSNVEVHPMGVDYSKLTPVLVKAIQELKAENDALRSELDSIKNKLGL